MNKTLTANRYEAIDPMSLILPPATAAKLFEARYPHVPLTSVIDKVVATMSKEDKQVALERTKAMLQTVKAVETALEHANK